MKDFRMVSCISRGALTVFITLNVFLLATKSIFGVSVSMAGVCTGLPRYENDPNRPPIPAHDGYKNPPAGQTTTTEGGVVVPHNPRYPVGAWVPARKYPQEQGIREKCRLTKCAKRPIVGDQGNRVEVDVFCAWSYPAAAPDAHCYCPYGRADRVRDEAAVRAQLDKGKAKSSGISLNSLIHY